MTTNQTNLVFVYGSLLSGLHNHRLLERGGAKLLGADQTAGLYQMRDLGYFPAVTFGGQLGHVSSPIKGELYDVNAATLEALDRLEGHPHFYVRQLIELESGRLAWMYFLRQPSGPVVVGGDWRACLTERGQRDPLPHDRERCYDNR